jgi:hypothetical protein
MRLGFRGLAFLAAGAVVFSAAVAQADPPAAQAQRSEPSLLGPAIVIGTGAASLGVATALRVSASADANDVRASCPTCDPNDVSSIGVRNTASEVLMLTGGAAVVGGLSWLALTLLSRSESRATAKIAPSASGVAVAF